MRKKVERVLRAHGFFSPARAVLVACSGGADSLVLLDVLARLRTAGGPRIVCAHFEHGIRGAESRMDARFVESFCAAREIPFTCGAADVPAYARAHKRSLETAARACRYDFLRAAGRAHGCGCIATAHHADDLAETVLMRILRGTGPAGLAAMRVWSGGLLRPLLDVTRAEIEAYAAAQGLAPRHDATNDQLDAVRNRIRHALLPALRAGYNPAVGAALTRLSTLAAEEDDLLSALAATAFARADGPQGLSQEVLRGLHPALQRRVLRLYWARETGGAKDFFYLHEERMRAMIGAHTARQDMPHGYAALSCYGHLRLCRTQAAAVQGTAAQIFLPIEREYAIIEFQSAELRMRRISSMSADDSCGTGDGDRICVDLGAVGSLVLRTRRTGDYMRLSVGRKKIKKILIDDHVPRARRDAIPLLALDGGSEILWIAGGRRSTTAPVTAETREILMIEYVKETTA